MSSLCESIVSGTVSGVAAGVILAVAAWLWRCARRRRQIKDLGRLLELWRNKILGAEGMEFLSVEQEQKEHWRAMVEQLRPLLDNGNMDALKPSEVLEVRDLTVTYDAFVAKSDLPEPGLSVLYSDVFEKLCGLKWLKLPPYEG